MMNNKKEAKQTPAPEYHTFVLVCEKCGVKIDPSGEVAQKVKKELKSKIKGSSEFSGLRPMVSSCMDICPENSISVAMMPLDGQQAKFFTVEVEPHNIPQSADQILAKVAALKAIKS